MTTGGGKTREHGIAASQPPRGLILRLTLEPSIPRSRQCSALTGAVVIRVLSNFQSATHFAAAQNEAYVKLSNTSRERRRTAFAIWQKPVHDSLLHDANALNRERNWMDASH